MSISFLSAGATENIAVGATAVTGGVTTNATGSTFVVGIATTDTFVATPVTDSKSNTYVQIESEATAFTVKQRLYYCENGVGGSGHTFTATVNSAGNLVSICAVEVRGGALSGILDQHAPANDDALTPFTSGTTGTTTQANEAVLAFYIDDRSSGAPTWGNGFSQIDDWSNTSGITGGSSGKLVSATGTQQSSFTGSLTEAQTIIATFKELSASSLGFVPSRTFGRGPNSRLNFVSRRLSTAVSNPDITVGLTGVAGTFSLGTLTALFQSMDARNLRLLGPGRTPDYLTLFRGRSLSTAGPTSANDVTVALSGATAAFSSGNLGVTFTIPLVGIAGTWAVGTMVPNFLVPLVGIAGTFATGNLTPSMQVALTGLAVISAQGTLVPVLTLGLTGTQITSAVGTMVPSSQVQLSGIPVTLTGGILTASGGTPVIPDLVSFTGFICNVGTLISRQ